MKVINVSEHDEDLYRASVDQKMRENCKTMALLVLLLVPSAAVLDYYVNYDHFEDLFGVRFISTLLCGGLYALIRKGHFLKKPFLTGLWICFIVSASITLQCNLLGGYESSYFSALNPVLMGIVLFFPYALVRVSWILALTIGLYIIGVLLHSGFILERPEILATNVYFLFITAIVGGAAAHFMERLRRESFFRYQEILRKNEIQSKFFANVSHELRTPLTLILGPITSLLKRQQLEQQDRWNLELVQKNAMNLLGHVEDLLEVARYEAGKGEVSYSNINVAALIKEVFSQFEGVTNEKKFQIKLDILPLLMAQVDVAKLQRVLMNLLSNSFKLTPHGGMICCVLEELAQKKFRLCIEDSGPGVPNDMKQLVFERFYQIEESNVRRSLGTGLGLSIVKDFVELHFGSVHVEDSLLGGARFVVTLPLESPEGAQFSLAPDAPIMRKEPGTISIDVDSSLNRIEDAQAPLVLVVEDNPDMNDYVCKLLSSKYRVVKALNGREGAIQALILRPDLILTDLMMPQFSGLDLLSEVKGLELTQSIPVVLLTARADEATRVKLLQLGANDYILKPFTSEELLARVENWISVKRSRDALQVDLQGRDVDLETLALEVIKKKNEAQQALEIREEFIALASHELKTPLTSLMLHSEMARRKLPCMPDGLERDYFTHFLDDIHFHLKRLVRMSEDMLDISRLKTGKIGLELRSTDMHAFLIDLLQRNANCLKEGVVELDVEAHKNFDVLCDPDRLEQVIMNLLNNGIKFGEGRPVSLHLKQGEDGVQIKVKDRGLGIPKDCHDKIFERFERASSSRNYGGLGLGLYITKGIVEAHGGSIKVQSRPKYGSEFIIGLPKKLISQ